MLCEPAPRVLSKSALTSHIGELTTQRLIPSTLHLQGLLPKTNSLELSSPEHFTKMVVRPFKSFKRSQHETDGKMRGLLARF